MRMFSWLSRRAFVSGAGGLRFKSRTGQIGVLQTARHHYNISLKGAVLPGAMMRRWAPQTRYTLERDTASITEDLILIVNGGIHRQWALMLQYFNKILKLVL